jgi:uncharacterized SAM-binding protein YcdF (DUF218 family)
VGSPAFERRAQAAAEACLERGAEVAIACGGRAWAGRVEADGLAERMSALGVPSGTIIRERCSLDTRDNARFAASLLLRRGICEIVLVTCAWHLPRASRLFRAAGLVVVGLPVEPPTSTVLERVYRANRERLSGWRDERRPMRIV